MNACEVCGKDDEAIGPGTCDCPECEECRAIVSLRCLALHKTGMKRYVTVYAPDPVTGSTRRWYVGDNAWYDLTRELANQMSCRLDVKRLDSAADYVFDVQPGGKFKVVKNRFATMESVG